MRLTDLVGNGQPRSADHVADELRKIVMRSATARTRVFGDEERYVFVQRSFGERLDLATDRNQLSKIGRLEVPCYFQDDLVGKIFESRHLDGRIREVVLVSL